MEQTGKKFSQVTPLLCEQYGEAKGQLILEHAKKRFGQLCAENAGDSKAISRHTHGEIFPCIRLYRAMQEIGIPAVDAAAFLDRSWSRMAEPLAASMRGLCRIPGVYKLMPRIFAFVAKHQFGEKQGFQAKWYPTDKNRVKFDMTKCLYCDVCRRYGCPELVPCFCHTDDVTDGNMHPRLCWNRTKTMGEGADVCDFDLFVTEKPTK